MKISRVQVMLEVVYWSGVAAFGLILRLIFYLTKN